MDAPSLPSLADALERFRTAVVLGEVRRGEARRRLAAFRLDLLRHRKREIALILSEGAVGGQALLQALSDGIDALRADLRLSGRLASHAA